MDLREQIREGRSGRWRWSHINRQTGFREAGCKAVGFATREEAVGHLRGYVAGLQLPSPVPWYANPRVFVIAALAVAAVAFAVGYAAGYVAPL